MKFVVAGSILLFVWTLVSWSKPSIGFQYEDSQGSLHLYDSLSQDTVNFFSQTMDVDNDGEPDKVFWNKHSTGDSLFVFQKKDERYECSLKTLNFSNDGVFVVDTVGMKTENKTSYFVISTYFNGAGGMKQDIYLQCGKKWKIAFTRFETTECKGPNKCATRICTIRQNLELNDHTNWKKYRYVTEARNGECVDEPI